MDHLRCGDLSDEVYLVGLEEVYILIVHHQLTDERTMVTDILRQLPRVNTGESDHAMALKSIRERLCGIPVRVVISIVVDNECEWMELPALEVESQIGGGIYILRRESVIAYDRVCADKHLTHIRGIRQGLGVAGHAGIEDNLSADTLISGTE